LWGPVHSGSWKHGWRDKPRAENCHRDKNLHLDNTLNLINTFFPLKNGSIDWLYIDYISFSHSVNFFTLITCSLLTSWHTGAAILLPILLHPAPGNGDNLCTPRISIMISANMWQSQWWARWQFTIQCGASSATMLESAAQAGIKKFLHVGTWKMSPENSVQCYVGATTTTTVLGGLSCLGGGGWTRAFLLASKTVLLYAFKRVNWYPNVISNNPSFRQKHAGVSASSNDSDITLYTLTENYTLPVTLVMGLIASVPPLLCAQNVVMYTHHQNITSVTLFARAAVMLWPFTQCLVMFTPFSGWVPHFTSQLLPYMGCLTLPIQV